MEEIPLTQFPTEAKFKYSWRNYQQRVLGELQKHLRDKHLHVVAPPGSGKTILGLEVALRLNQPTLILAPTVAIRNQWIQRFCEMFLQTHEVPYWISSDIRHPKFLTVSTYQGLHAACKGLDDEEGEEQKEKTKKSGFVAIVKLLKQQNIGTIVVDEAHHLKNEWWVTLNKIKQKLKPVIVGLTATPPYDVVYAEWERYLELNGAVDAEITVPELVKEGDLCPHQDYIYFCHPSKEEQEKIVGFRENINHLYNQLRKDEILAEAISQHPVFLEPENYLDWIYNNIAHYSAILIFLHECGTVIPLDHFKLIGAENFEIPPFDSKWLAILLEFYLFKEKKAFEENKTYKKHQKELEIKLRHFNIIEHSQINFENNKAINALVTSSISKLNAIREIVDFEYDQLGDDLRMVILTDYIRKEFLANDIENNVNLNKIGVASIFEKLRRTNIDNKKIGILTGSLVVIPKEALLPLGEKNRKFGIKSIEFKPLIFDKNYLILNVNENLKQNIVHTVTELFQDGHIQILIGTQALLGEGWDAPAVNSLVLASFVGSFVLSNQMRGRAIRTQRGNDDKTGNVWHLACIDLLSEIGGKDLELMERRFKGFVGVGADDIPLIESGIGRLGIPKEIHVPTILEKKNKDTFKQAAKRDALKQKWHTAVNSGTVALEQIRIPYPIKERTYQQSVDLYYNKTARNVAAELGFGLLAFSQQLTGFIFENIGMMRTAQGMYTILTSIGIGGLAIFGRRLYVTSKILLKYKDITKDIQQISNALLATLIEVEIIKTPVIELKAEATVDSKGAMYCCLQGGSTFEQSTYINALQEIIIPIDNPRYVVVRKNKKVGGIIKQKDYHAVPELLGRKKATTDVFIRKWAVHVGDCDLIYTRTPEGRKMLLKSRMEALSTQLEDNIDRVNKWK